MSTISDQDDPTMEPAIYAEIVGEFFEMLQVRELEVSESKTFELDFVGIVDDLWD